MSLKSRANSRLRQGIEGDKPPVARNAVTIDSDLDVLQRRAGETENSATTVAELSALGVVSKTSSGTYVATKQRISGTQGIYNFLKGF